MFPFKRFLFIVYDCVKPRFSQYVRNVQIKYVPDFVWQWLNNVATTFALKKAKYRITKLTVIFPYSIRSPKSDKTLNLFLITPVLRDIFSKQ